VSVVYSHSHTGTQPIRQLSVYSTVAVCADRGKVKRECIHKERVTTGVERRKRPKLRVSRKANFQFVCDFFWRPQKNCDKLINSFLAVAQRIAAGANMDGSEQAVNPENEVKAVTNEPVIETQVASKEAPVASETSEICIPVGADIELIDDYISTVDVNTASIKSILAELKTRAGKLFDKQWVKDRLITILKQRTEATENSGQPDEDREDEEDDESSESSDDDIASEPDESQFSEEWKARFDEVVWTRTSPAWPWCVGNSLFLYSYLH
jgi:hypothetical protein